MIKNLVETFKKWFKVKQMITEDKIAAAQLAQIFGSELLRIDQNTTERAHATQQATRVDPKQILLQGLSQNQSQNNREKEMLSYLQREAESSYPLNEQTISPIQPLPAQSFAQEVTAPANHSINPVFQQAAPAFDSNLQSIFEKINTNLERIANSLENVDVQIKSKRTRHLK